MVKLKSFFGGTLAVLAVLLLTGCHWNENPVRTSLDADTPDLSLQIGESATRAGFSKASDAVITYESSKPAVATVDSKGTVKAMSEGDAVITISMGEAREGWYAAKSMSYRVYVSKTVSAVALKNVDKSTPLTLVASEDGKITVYFMNGITLTNDIKYTINGGTEQTISKNTEGSYDIVVSKGDVVQLYSTNTSLGGGGGGAEARGLTRAADSGAKYINIRPSMKTEIYGNVMSLLKGKDNLEEETEIKGKNAFYGLFDGADKLVSSEDRELVLPATKLTEGCYENMFSGCKGIEKAPELPADKCEKNCYKQMFSDCSKVTTFKILATDFSAEGCKEGIMDNAGTEAETAPVLILNENANPNDIKDAIPDYVKIAVAVSEITLEPNSPQTLKVGEMVTLKATIKPENAADKSVEWSSSNKSVAVINPDGLSESLEAAVTAVSAGTTIITVCTPDGSVSATCELKVEAAPVPDDTPQVYKVWVYGEDPNLEPPFSPGTWNAAALRFSSNEGHHFRTLTDYEYFSLKTLIFDVSDATDDCTMRVMTGWWSPVYADYAPVLNGQMKIQITEEMAKDCAKSHDGKDLDLMLYGGSCTINSVYYMEGESQDDDGANVPVTSVSLPESITMRRVSEATSSNMLAAQIRITPENATDKSMTWTFDDPNLVRVNKYGVAFVQPDVTGVVHVTATANDGSGKSATCTITVKNVGSIEYETTEISKTPGSTFTNNSLKLVGDGSVTYTSSNTNVAKVNASTGEVTIPTGATGGQTAIISATASDSDNYLYPSDAKSASYTVTVIPVASEGEREDYGPGSW